MRWLDKILNVNSNHERQDSNAEPEIFTFGNRFDFRFPYEKDHFIIPKYEGIKPFKEGLAPVKLCGKWGYIDKKRREIIAPKYDDAECFCEGLARVALNGKWGFIDKAGCEIISLKYDGVGNFREGVAYAKLNGKEFYIDRNGTEYNNTD